MLYVTTRNDQNPVTTQHVLQGSRDEDGGLYLPFRFPVLTPEHRKSLAAMHFNQRIAAILNLFFSTKLTSWDVDFAVGRYPVRLESLGHRVVMAECWHNPDWSVQRLADNLTKLVAAESSEQGSWMEIAIRIAILAASLCEQEVFQGGSVDVAVISGEFTWPISLWYARKMGLPVGNIVCCRNENKQLWELICHGQLRTDSVSISTIVPEADVPVPVNLERLIYDCGGREQVERYLHACRNGMTYCVEEDFLRELRKGLYVSVVSSSRIRSAIPNVYNSHSYLLNPESALAYCGLLDYRVKTGATGQAMVVCDKSPVCAVETVADAMGISVEEMKRMI